MTYVPHLRVTLSGKLGSALGPEQFSFGFALARVDQAPVGNILEPNDAVWTDIRNDCQAFFSRVDSRIHQTAVLQMVKIAKIGADGKYSAPPVEKPVANITGGNAGNRPANQLACAATLHTAGDIGRIKGRFYIPVMSAGLDDDGRWPAADVDQVESSVDTFLEAINNQPGIDVLGLAVHVASQGRFNANGTQRVAPGNHLVTAVSIGRVPDTIRRRRNKLSEARTSRPVSS